MFLHLHERKIYHLSCAPGTCNKGLLHTDGHIPRNLSEAVLVKVVIEVKEKIIFASEFDSQRKRIDLLAHDQDLDLDGLQSAHLRRMPVSSSACGLPACSCIE
jgi:hypothetical protein